MPLKLIDARSKAERNRFVEFPYQLHAGSPYWVPPLRSEQRDWIVNENTPLFRGHPAKFFLVEEQGQVQGRVAMVRDEVILAQKGLLNAYFTFLDFEDREDVFDLLLDAMLTWTHTQSLAEMVGPVSPTKGDDYRGMLYWGGFNARPVLMNVYNPPYYVKHMERCGFEMHTDLVAYHYDLSQMDHSRQLRVLEYAKRRYGFTIDPFNLKDIEGEARDIQAVIEQSIPDWFELIAPTAENILEIAGRLKRFADPGMVLIARDHERRPIGFNLALPDYNEVFHHLNGNLGLLGMLKFLWYRRKIHGARSFVMFTVPEWRKKGVSHGLYLTAFQRAQELGYTYGEGSTIGAHNTAMRRDAESVGGVHYRTYRIWKKRIAD